MAVILGAPFTMKRIQQWAHDFESASQPESKFPAEQETPLPLPEVGQSKLTSGDAVLPHSLFVPLHFERNYAYPLIIWLHGPGDNEAQLRRVMPLISMRNYVAIAPRATAFEDGDDQSTGRYCWRQTDNHILLAEQRVMECIELACTKCCIAPSRVFLAGFDCGGTMAFRLGLNHPERFAGILSFGGAFPTGNRPLVRIEQARRVPLFIAHGRDSVKYPEDEVCNDLRLFHVAGMSVTLRQYPCGDEISTQMLSDMDAWVMEQVTGVDSTSPPSFCPPPSEAN